MKALITGAAGFVGRHLTAACLERGWDVVAYDVVRQPPEGFDDVLHYVRDDCRTLFRQVVPTGFIQDRDRYDVVFHCAAIVGGRAKIDGDPLAIAENLSIDAEMFRWAVRTGQRRVIYFSSSAAYPVIHQYRDDPRFLAESFIDVHSDVLGVPDQTYGWAKLTGERLAAIAAEAGVPVHVFRPFSGYGTDQSLDYPFPSFIDRAVRGANPFEVWGDGTQVRDWVHISDIVAAVFAAIDADQFGPLNLCTGVPTTFADLAAMVLAEAGLDVPVKCLPDRPTGVHTRVGDPSRMLDLYHPVVTVRDGIRRALADWDHAPSHR